MHIDLHYTTETPADHGDWDLNRAQGDMTAQLAAWKCGTMPGVEASPQKRHKSKPAVESRVEVKLL